MDWKFLISCQFTIYCAYLKSIDEKKAVFKTFDTYTFPEFSTLNELSMTNYGV